MTRGYIARFRAATQARIMAQNIFYKPRISSGSSRQPTRPQPAGAARFYYFRTSTQRSILRSVHSSTEPSISVRTMSPTFLPIRFWPSGVL